MWTVLLAAFGLVVSGNHDQSCPDVKVVGIGDADKLTILRGCPGYPGSQGGKGDMGTSGEKGQKGCMGDVGKVGPPGQKGEKGETGKMETLYAARNCKELQDQGEVLSDWYTIYPDGVQPMKVLCDMDTDGGGWIVFQRRWDGSVDFFRDWADYKKGFGSRLNEFWPGNDYLWKITSSGTWELRIDLQDFENKKIFAKYSHFKILDESEKYQLNVGFYREGNGGDSLPEHNNMNFTTKDQDNDNYAENCALRFKGGWWYNSCHSANLNGLYYLGEHTTYADGINWGSAKGAHYSFKHVEMKIRAV